MSSHSSTSFVPHWLTVQQAAAYMQVSADTVRELISTRKLRATYFTDRTLRVSRADIEALAEKNKVN